MSEIATWSNVLSTIVSGHNLSGTESAWAMDEIIAGRATDAQISAFLVALSAKGETIEEMVGFRDAVLRNALPLHISRPALDIVGTGGDQLHTVNVSSMASLVCAAAGIPVLKHGNKAASSASGSSDVFAELGVNLDLSVEKMLDVFETTNMGFAFAAKLHPGFRHVADVRKEIGIPTVFNILGPLCNPARPAASCIGVASLSRVQLVVGVLAANGNTGFVIRGDDGMDELTTTGTSHVWQIAQGVVSEYEFDPRDVGFELSTLADLTGGTPTENAQTVHSVFAGTSGPIREIVLLNAAAGLSAFELSQSPIVTHDTFTQRIERNIVVAANAIDEGFAAAKLDEWVAATNA